MVMAFMAPTPRVVRSAVRALRGAAVGDVNLLRSALKASLGFCSGFAVGAGASTTVLGAGAGLGVICGGLIGLGASSAVGGAGAGFGTGTSTGGGVSLVSSLGAGGAVARMFVLSAIVTRSTGTTGAA